jgi:phosphoglycerate dehydrogenase-like enzyme
METRLMMIPQSPSRDHHSEARKFSLEDYPKEALRLTHARILYHDKETTMVEAMTTEATGTILLTTMGMDKDTVEIVEKEGAITVETEEEVEMTVAEMVVEMILMLRSKRRSTTSRKGRNVTRMNIPNTRTSDTGTHSSLK